MKKFFITNVTQNNDEAVGLPSTFGDETYPPHHNSAYDDFDEDDVDVEEEETAENAEDALPPPSSTFDEADYSARGEPSGGSGEEPLPVPPSTLPTRGRF